MIDPKRREMFTDLYRLAEYYEKPPLQPGDVDGNCAWFQRAQDEALVPFLRKWGDDGLAGGLAFAVLDEANRLGREANLAESVEVSVL